MRNMKLLISLVLAIGIVVLSCAGRTEAALPVETISVPVISDMKSYEIPDNEALALIKDMKCGWNLGNTFDSFDGYTAHSEGTGMESGWGAAKTTRKLIDTISDAGFNAIRIPVSWHNHMDGNDRIDVDWLARVR